MKILISKLDNGYTMSVTHPAVSIPDGDSEPERKERFAFESEDSMYEKLNALIPIPHELAERL